MRRHSRATSRISKARNAERIEAATVDAHDESEQTMGWFTVIEADPLAVPFETTVLGVSVIVERVDLSNREQVVAICRCGRNRQVLALLELPRPQTPPGGAEWIEAYRQWRGDE